MTNDVNFFTFLDKNYRSKVKVANQQISNVCGIGSREVNCGLQTGEMKILKLTNVLYVPSFDSGLLSMRIFDRLGHRMIVENGMIVVNDKYGKELAVGDVTDVYTQTI